MSQETNEPFVHKACQNTAVEAHPVTKQTISGALLMESKSGAYVDLGAKALLSVLVGVSN